MADYTYSISESIKNHVPEGDKSLRKMLVGISIHSTLGRNKIQIPTPGKDEVSDVTTERINSQFNFFNNASKAALTSLAAACRNELARMSFVNVDGITFLSKEAFPTFTKVFDAYKKEFDVAKTSFLDDYDRAYKSYEEALTRWVDSLTLNEEDKERVTLSYKAKFPSYGALQAAINLSYSVVCYPTINENDLASLDLSYEDRQALLQDKETNDIDAATDYVVNELRRIALIVDRLGGKLNLIFNAEDYKGAGYQAYIEDKLASELDIIKASNSLFEVEQIDDLIEEIKATSTMSTVGAMTELSRIVEEIKAYYAEIGRTFNVKMKNFE